MTYNVGSFYLTTLTFPHPMIVYKRNETKHPTIFLGMMTSSSRDTIDYEYLASNLKKRSAQTLTYGTDGEAALEIGLENVYPIEGVPEKKIVFKYSFYQTWEQNDRELSDNLKNSKKCGSDVSIQAGPLSNEE